MFLLLRPRRFWFVVATVTTAVTLLVAANIPDQGGNEGQDPSLANQGSEAVANEPAPNAGATPKPAGLPRLPLKFSLADDDASQPQMVMPDGSVKALTLDSRLQRYLTSFIKSKGNPIATAVVVSVETGEVLAMVQGMEPTRWGSETHSALYPKFPAASLFKSVIATAAMDLTGLDEDKNIVLWGGCADVKRSGVWMKEDSPRRWNRISLRRAYGKSCNGLFAKLSVDLLGLSVVNEYAARFRWGAPIDSDFYVEPSPINVPEAKNASVHAVGRYAAGFGYVGTSAVHAAWRMVAIANGGVPKTLKIFRSSTGPQIGDPAAMDEDKRRIFSADTAARLREIMKATVNGGSSSYAYRRGKHRKLRPLVGGKTGTLTGQKPRGVTTWFAGMMPIDKPKYVVAAVVILEDLWHIKGPNLAAEAFWALDDLGRPTSKLAQKYGSRDKVH